MQTWGARLLHVGIMGVDGMDGRVTVDPQNGSPTVAFGDSATTKRLFAGARCRVCACY